MQCSRICAERLFFHSDRITVYSLCMKLFDEFKTFAMKGNMVDMAVGIMIGAAFSTLVKSLVDDIIMPVIGQLSGGVDFSNLYINLSGGTYTTLAEAQAAEAATINYGLFLNAVVSFLIVSWVLFILIKGMNRLKKEEPKPAPSTHACPHCCTDISKKATRCPHCTSELPA